MRRRAAGQARAHHVRDAHEDRGLPVALGAEAVALGHEPLHGEAGQLLQRAEVFEVVVKAPKPPSSRNERSPSSIAAPSRSDWCRSPPGSSSSATSYASTYSATSASMSASVTRVDRRGELVHAPRVDLHAEAQLASVLSPSVTAT